MVLLLKLLTKQPIICERYPLGTIEMIMKGMTKNAKCSAQNAGRWWQTDKQPRRLKLYSPELQKDASTIYVTSSPDCRMGNEKLTWLRIESISHTHTHTALQHKGTK